MFDNEKFLIEISWLVLSGQVLTARCKAMACRCFTTRMKALQIIGVIPQPA